MKQLGKRILSKENFPRALSDPRVPVKCTDIKANRNLLKNVVKRRTKRWGRILSKFANQNRSIMENDKSCESDNTELLSKTLRTSQKMKICSDEPYFRNNSKFSHLYNPFRESDAESIDPEELKADSPFKQKSPCSNVKFSFNDEETVQIRRSKYSSS